jgi:hypothetical protein
MAALFRCVSAVVACCHACGVVVLAWHIAVHGSKQMQIKQVRQRRIGAPHARPGSAMQSLKVM